MEHNNNKQNGGGGFLLGVLVGVAITLLFTTKKGREIFKDTVDRAIDKFSDVQNKFDETEIYDDEDDGDDYVKPVPATKEPVKEVRHIAAKEEAEIEEVEEETEIEEEPAAEPEVEEVTPPAPKVKPVHVPEKPEVIPFVEEEKEEAEKPEPPKKSSPVRKFFKLKK